MTNLFSRYILAVAVALECTNAEFLRESARLLPTKAEKKTCGPLNGDTQSLVSALNTAIQEVESTDDDICEYFTKTVDLEQDDQDMYCYPTFTASETLGCCCHEEAPATRTISIQSDLDAFYESIPNICPFSKIDISMTVAPCDELECCDSCKTWGDPRGKSFINNHATPGTRVRATYLTCDNRVVTKRDGDGNVKECSSQLSLSKQAKKKCEELDGCEWIGNRNDYRFDRVGGPCQPDGTIDFNMLMYEDDSVIVQNKMGERGVIESISFEFKGIGELDSNRILVLDSKTDCFNLAQNGGGVASVQDVQEPDGGSGPDNDYQIAFNANGPFRFDRRVSVNSETAVADVFWNVKNEDTGMRVFMSCKGATNGAGIFQGSTPFTTNSGEPSTRPDVTTRMNAAIFHDIATASSDDLSGFCSDGTFTGVTSASNDVEQCPEITKLSKGDVAFFKQRPYCANLLEQNSCEHFETPRKATQANVDNFNHLMELCIREFCSEAFNSDINQFASPPGSDVEECFTDVFDFGARETYQLYFNTFPKQTIIQDVNCNQFELVYVTEDGETVLKSGDSTILTNWLETLDVTIDGQGGTYKHPTDIYLRASNCQDECEPLPSLTLNVEYKTQCQELIELTQLGPSLQVGDVSVDTAKFG